MPLPTLPRTGRQRLPPTTWTIRLLCIFADGTDFREGIGSAEQTGPHPSPRAADMETHTVDLASSFFSFTSTSLFLHRQPLGLFCAASPISMIMTTRTATSSALIFFVRESPYPRPSSEDSCSPAKQLKATAPLKIHDTRSTISERGFLRPWTRSDHVCASNQLTNALRGAATGATGGEARM